MKMISIHLKYSLNFHLLVNKYLFYQFSFHLSNVLCIRLSIRLLVNTSINPASI